LMIWIVAAGMALTANLPSGITQISSGIKRFRSASRRQPHL
jgi:hypothetical protein